MRESMIMKRRNPMLCRRNSAPCLIFVLSLVSILTIAGSLQPQTRPDFDRAIVDSLDPTAWNGIVFLAKAFGQPASFALR
jgi:hypothetical protein